jgi:RHS repeat-associated protein
LFALTPSLHNRLTNVVDSRLAGATNTTYGFDAVGNLQRIQYPNSVTNLCQYDSLNRLTNLVWKTNGNMIASFAYTLGATGNRTALLETNHGVNRGYAWNYDPLYRLTNETVTGTAPAGNIGYGYDDVGNRTIRTNNTSGLGLTNQSFSFTANDWLTSDVYDSNGNTTNSSSKSYQYDYENRLTNFNNGQVIIVYDADGNRVKKIANGVTNLYLVDTRNPSGYAQVLEEFTVSGGTTNLAKAYTYGLNLISQRTLNPQPSTNYFVYDGHGSTRYLSDKGGNFVNAFAYDAYGTLIASNGAPQTVYLYTGQQFDPDIGLYYNRARYLNPQTGRFWTMDTFAGNNEDPLSLHKYLYGADNPVNNIDPDGENYYFGGNPGATTMDMGHFWVAVDTATGVLKYDYGLKGYTGPGGSWAQITAARRALHGPGQAEAKPVSSIKQAAGTDTYYEFDESRTEDAAMMLRMLASTLHPADYHLFTHNCGHASFEIAEHGWPPLAPLNPLPKAFLGVVKDQWRIRHAVRAPMNTYVNSIPDIIMTMDLGLP